MTDDELEGRLRDAFDATLKALRLSEIARGRVSGKMNPKGLEWHESVELASATSDLARHASWMIKFLKSLL